MSNNTSRIVVASSASDPMKALEYKARRAIEASSAAIESTGGGTPSHKAKTWRIGKPTSHYGR